MGILYRFGFKATRLPGLLFISSLILSGAFYSHADASEDRPRIIPIELGNYRFVPGVIYVSVGEPIILQLVNSDALTPHNFVLQDANDELDVDVNVYAGETVEVRLKPQSTGQQTFYCNKKLLFMKSHRQKGMEGTLIVLSE